jgi:hypothetical protein
MKKIFRNQKIFKNILKYQTNKKTVFSKTKDFLLHPPPIPYKYYKFVIRTINGTIIISLVIVIVSYITYNLNLKKIEYQEKEDLEKYNHEIKNLNITKEPCKIENMESNIFKSNSIFQNIITFISLSLRATTVLLKLSPLFFTYPICLLSTSFFRNIWLNYMIWAMESLGPCFIKLSQWIATRRDLFSNELIESCSKLQSNAPEHSIDETEKMIEKLYHKKIDELFLDFNKTPIASGAIAQGK